MTTLRHTTQPVVRALLLSSKLPLLDYVTEQQKTRTNCLASPSCTPAITAVLTSWNTLTDKAASLYAQEQQLAQQLEAVRQERQVTFQQAHLAEITFVTTAEASAQNNPSVLTSLGLALRQPKGVRATTPPAAPAAVTVLPGTDPGALHVKWTRVAKVRTYQIAISPEPVTATSWTTLTPQSKRTLKVGDLAPGTSYQVRVAAVNAQGASAWATGSGAAR